MSAAKLYSAKLLQTRFGKYQDCYRFASLVNLIKIADLQNSNLTGVQTQCKHKICNRYDSRANQ